MRPSSLTLIRALFTSCAVGLLVASCAQGSSELGLDLGPNGGASGNGGAGGTTTTPTGQGGTTTGSDVTSSTTTSTTTTGGFTTSSSTTTSSTTTGGFTTSSSTSTSTSTSTSSSGMGSTCDTGAPNTNDCQICQSCSQNLPSCSNLFVECELDFGCSDILFCWQCTCVPGDSACLQACIANDPGASATLFNNWAQCVVCSCAHTCSVPGGTCP